MSMYYTSHARPKTVSGQLKTEINKKEK